MARIRTVKPEFWSSPSMRGANPWARLLFVAMWNWADDAGRGTANVRELHGFAFPDDEDPITPVLTELPALLVEVRDRWDVQFYKVAGRRYYAIPSFDQHQRTERKAQGRHPGPEEGEPYDPGPLAQGRPLSQGQSPTVGTSPGRDGAAESSTAEERPGRDTSSPLPDDWEPTDLHRKIATGKGLDPDHEANQFRAFSAAHAKTYSNPYEAFRYWLGNAHPRRPRPGTNPAPDPDRDLTDTEVDDILGPESPPTPPRDVTDAGVEACKAWARDNDPPWRHARRERAKTKLTRTPA